eukprot:TRINITY_DN662_c0_g1_i1.p1 TRINITY_DN662_c0_g1~~TRINITY_DN662_c0_g1_i1.p1  ORF type:complete len:1003 (+),score=264.68 TRINITY_DN662_c0_g1_i1:46-3054(+)
MKTLVFVFAFIAIFITCLGVQDFPKVLVISSYGIAYHRANYMISIITSAFSERPDIITDYEFLLYSTRLLELESASDIKYEQVSHFKYIDAEYILTVGEVAMNFVLNFHDSLFSSLKGAVYVESSDVKTTLPSWITGVNVIYDFEAIVSLIKQIMPNCKKLHVIYDITLYNYSEIIASINKYSSFEVEFYNSLDTTLSELIKMLSVYNSVSNAVLLLRYRFDKEKVLVFQEGVRVLIDNVFLPIFCVHEDLLVSGVIGGLIEPMELNIETGIDVLIQGFGKSTIFSNNALNTTLELILNYEELSRFDLLANVPQNAKFINSPHFIFEKYFQSIVFILILILVQSFFTIMICTNISKRTFAENNLNSQRDVFCSVLDSIPLALRITDTFTQEELYKNLQTSTLVNNHLSFSKNNSQTDFVKSIDDDFDLLVGSLKTFSPFEDDNNETNEIYCSLFDRWYKVQNVKIRWMDKRWAKLTILTDITTEKGVWSEKEERENRVISLLDRMCESVIAVDCLGMVTHINPAGVQMLSIPTFEVLSKEIDDLFQLKGINDGKTVPLLVHEVFKTKKQINSDQISLLVTKTGRYMISQSAAPLFNQNGQIIGVVLILVDLTRLHFKQVMERRDEIISSIQESMNGLIHDVNNFLQMMKDGINRLFAFSKSLNNELNAKCVADIARQFDMHLSATVGLLYELGGKEIDIISEPIDIHELIENIVNYAGFQTKYSDLKLFTYLEAENAVVLANSCSLHSVFVNLLVNAADAMNGNGSVCFSTKIETNEANVMDGYDQNGVLVIYIDDDGPGIDPKLAGRLFQPYVSTKTNGGGLGLYRVSRVLNSYGGSITTMIKEGPGAHFVIRLPLSDEIIRIIDFSEIAFDKSTKIMVVDDDLSIISILKSAFSNYNNVDVIAFNNIKEANSSLLSHEYSLAILDLVVGNESGITFGEKFHEMFPNTPVLFSTGHISLPAEPNFSNFLVLHKPFDSNEVVRMSFDLINGNIDKDLNEIVT